MDSMKVNTELLREQAQAATATGEFPYLAQVLTYILNQVDQTGSVSLTNSLWTQQMFIEQAMRQLETELNRPEVKAALEKCIEESLAEQQPTYILVGHETGGAAHLCEQTADGKVMHSLCGATRRTEAGWGRAAADAKVCKRCGQLAEKAKRQ